MAQIALGAVGAGVGAFFGNPMLGFSIGMTVGGLLFPPKGPNPGHGPLDDLRVSGSGYGVAIPQIYGNGRVGGNLIWSTDLVEHSSKKKAGKGTRPTVKTYTYTCSFAMSICRALEGSQRVRRVFAEDRLIYDADDPSVTTPATSLTIYDGSETQTPDPFMAATQGDVPAYRGMCYAMFVDLDLTAWGNRIPNITFEVDTNGDTVYLDAVLEDVFQQAGLTSLQYNVGAGSATRVRGFILTQRQSVAQQIEALLNAYFFDVAEIDGVLKLVARGQAVATTVPAGDLAAWTKAPGGSGATNPQPSSRVTTRRLQDVELPQRLELSYLAANQLYALRTVAAIRFTKTHQQKRLVSYPLVLTEYEARQIVEKQLDQFWVEREQFEFVLPIEYLFYCATDVFNLPVGDSTLRVRITKQDAPLFGAIKFSAVLDDDGLLTQVADADAATEPTITAQAILTTPVLWSGNAVRDVDAIAGTGVYAGGFGPADEDWPGATIYLSRDDGDSYQLLDTLTEPVTYGTVNGDIGPPPDDVADSLWDDATTITVVMQSGVPSSVTDADVLNGLNAARVGNEIIQFVNVTPTGNPDEYALTRLLRGQRGTDYWWDLHEDGEDFVLLEEGPVLRIDLDESLAGKDLLFKVVTVDSSLAATTAVPLSVTGDEWKEYSSAQGDGTRDGSDNLTITWDARARAGYELHDGTDVDDPTSTYEFEIDILSDDLDLTVVRTITGITTNSYTYTAADQTTDFGSPQPGVTLTIYRMGRLGRGYPYTITV